ncbi:uncharacterized protein [Watersipora subatra]|uniref:uncharacterized protein n=1 Tax=Watersipora subatra TaxID=2589382 RepID=UPI00355C8568
MTKHLTTEEKAVIVHLHKSNKSQREIVKETGHSRKSVRTTIANWKENGSLAEKPRSRRPRKFTERSERTLVRMSLHDRHLTSQQLTKEWKNSAGVQVHPSTVRRILIKYGLRGCKARRKPLLMENHRKKNCSNL